MTDWKEIFRGLIAKLLFWRSEPADAAQYLIDRELVEEKLTEVLAEELAEMGCSIDQRKSRAVRRGNGVIEVVAKDHRLEPSEWSWEELKQRFNK